MFVQLLSNIALVEFRTRYGPWALITGGSAGVGVRTISLDITAEDLLERLGAVTEDLEIGLLVHNVGSWERDHGWFLDDPLDVGVKTIEVNCVAPMKLAAAYGKGMRDRGRGGIDKVNSMSRRDAAERMARIAYKLIGRPD